MVKARLIILAVRITIIVIVIAAMILYAIVLTSSPGKPCQIDDRSLSPGAALPAVANVTLDAEQSRTAHLIAAVVSERVPAPLRQQALTIALMTAMTEASLRNPAGGHLDSVGTFQQRAGWGTKAQRNDVRTATAAFLGGPAPPSHPGLLDIPRWPELPPWTAAQAVQRSAYPDGSNYRRWHDFATRLAHALTTSSDAIPLDCPSPSAGGATVTVPGDIPPKARIAIAWALKQLGTPYVWGGRCEDPRLQPSDPQRQNCDCSSLTMQAYRHAGVILPRTSQEQARVGTPVTVNQARAGDLVFSEPGATGPGHVTLHIGNGQLISAPGRGKVVRLVEWRTYAPRVIAVRRLV
ncbi:C40 family peptidase [Nonomuraea sp. SYSU D8015]|uniref:C40 family peptidase n=1 Tax=Nonomuraea sp. SYSU D8015 TaxID=2593644 RepID=UPI0016602920|nr:C40 family peptidase [Nonomuraea sp. SYSU D8015]